MIISQLMSQMLGSRPSLDGNIKEERGQCGLVVAKDAVAAGVKGLTSPTKYAGAPDN
jgi:hypothetical protein